MTILVLPSMAAASVQVPQLPQPIRGWGRRFKGNLWQTPSTRPPNRTPHLLPTLAVTLAVEGRPVAVAALAALPLAADRSLPCLGDNKCRLQSLPQDQGTWPRA